jgi:protein TonB
MRPLFSLPLSVALHLVAAALVAFVALSSPDPLPPVPPPPAMAPPAGIVTRLPARGETRASPRPQPARSRLQAPSIPPLEGAIVAPKPDDVFDRPDAPDLPGLGRDDAPPCLAGCNPGVPGGDPLGSGSAAAAPPAAVRPGGEIRPPVKLRHVAPVYPEIARLTRIEGNVVLECTISPEGRIVDARVLSGPPLLQAAAAEAVQQWVYRPTLLNGVAVPVIMTVTVHFTLSR